MEEATQVEHSGTGGHYENKDEVFEGRGYDGETVTMQRDEYELLVRAAQSCTKSRRG